MKKVYIVLSQTGTLFSRAIHLYTRDPYNHASISFDRNLEVMYSFGRRKRYNPMDSGFIKENFNEGLFVFFPDTYCCVLEIEVTDDEYKAMIDTINIFEQNEYNYRYNLMGVLSYTVGVPLSRKEHYFCSQFVSYILSKTNFWSFTPELTKPIDFLKLPNKKIVFEGPILEFQEHTKIVAFN